MLDLKNIQNFKSLENKLSLELKISTYSLKLINPFQIILYYGELCVSNLYNYATTLTSSSFY